MFYDSLLTFLFSLSPAGEARLGIPYGVLAGVPVVTAFTLGLIGNLLVFPMFYAIIKYSNIGLWRFKWYKKYAIYLTKRAKRLTSGNFKKYGIFGLMIFVMIPLPVTGAYIGTLAAYVLGIKYKPAFIAVSTGIIISCILVGVMMYFAKGAI